MTFSYYNYLVLLATYLLSCAAKYNQRVFIDIPDAISFADPLKSGFRVILSEHFVQTQLAAQNLPTIFVTAVPLHQGERRFTKVLYPESVNVDKQIKVDGLREHSWYYVCIEWESFNRHNETTGTACKLYQTLDRFGKTSDSIVSDLEIVTMTDMSLAFRLRTEADFPVRLTAYLKGGQLNPAAQVFHLTEPVSLDVMFPFLRPDTLYGQLCIVEEPLVTAYTAMGRHIQGMHKQKCYFDKLSTQPAHIESPMEPMSNEIRAYKHIMNSAMTRSTSMLSSLLLVVATLLVVVGV